MLQRIQTVYLLVVAILMGSMFFYPFAELLATDDQVFAYYFNGLFIEGNKSAYFLTIPPAILLFIITLVSIITIFLYKKRILQIRLSAINLMLMLGYIGLNYYYIKSFSSQLTGVISYNLIVIFPLISSVLTYLAIRAIGKDEALLRSLDRIR
jgi:hypothetical protein